MEARRRENERMRRTTVAVHRVTIRTDEWRLIAMIRAVFP
jgi:hypothetical protein